MNTIIGVIAKPLGMLLNLLYNWISVYGLAIVIFTIIVKVCLYPLYMKQMKSTAGMSKVQPKMKALQQKYANDKETLNVKMAELYKEEGNQSCSRLSAASDSDAYSVRSLCAAEKPPALH